jgi:para-nitrobenzyl esterase
MSNDRRTVLIAAYGGEDVFNTNIISDVIFTEAASMMANAHVKLGAPTYLYRFSVLSKGAPAMLKAAPHATDREYVFKTLAASPWPTDDMDAKQAALISAYWVAFVKTGDPNGGKLPAWPRYNSKQPKWLNFTNDGPRVEDVGHRKALREIAKKYD